jgi:hypothetical protein
LLLGSNAAAASIEFARNASCRVSGHAGNANIAYSQIGFCNRRTSRIRNIDRIRGYNPGIGRI